MSNPFAKAPQINYQPSGITNPTGTSVGPYGGVQQSPQLQQNIAGLQSTFGQEAGAFSNLAATVQPGFSQFRQAGMQALQSRYAAAQSTLQQSLAQRRIAGSSFANDQISNLNAQQAQDEANFQAQSYLAELQSSANLIQAQYQAQTNQFATAINQSNIDSALAAQLTSNNNQIAAQIASANAQLQAKSDAGAGSFFGTLLGLGTGTSNSTLGGSAISSGVGSLTSGLGGLFGSGSGVFSSGAPAIASTGGYNFFGNNNATLQ